MYDTCSNTKPTSHATWQVFPSWSHFPPPMHTFETWALIMCLSYNLTSQRRQTLWKSGNLMYDGQRATGLPHCLALQKGQLLMYHQRNVCKERRKWNSQNRERGQAETEQNDPPMCQRSLKVEGKQHVLPGRHPCNENATHFWKEYYFLTENAEHTFKGDKITAGVSLVHFLSFPAWRSIHLRQKKPYSASETWSRGYCSVEHSISCGKWRPKSILQAELLTTYRIKNPWIYHRHVGREVSCAEGEWWRWKEKVVATWRRLLSFIRAEPWGQPQIPLQPACPLIGQLKRVHNNCWIILLSINHCKCYRRIIGNMENPCDSRLFCG